jgi:hypothetical protein
MPLISGLYALSGCNSGEIDDADGLGGAADGGSRNGTGGGSEATGGKKPTSGGASASGGSETGPTGGKGEPPGAGGASGGEAGAQGSGGVGEPKPRWLAFQTPGTGAGNPLLVVRSDGSSDPVEVSEGAFSHRTVSWAADGKSLLFIEYGCCGESNAAFELPVEDDELGSALPIHPPLPASSLIHYAAYSPSGAHILARIPESTDIARYALRLRDAAPTDWLSLTPALGSPQVDTAPVWSPDSDAVLMVQGDRSAGERVYRFDVEAELTAAYEIVSLPPGDTVQEFLWSPDSQYFAIRSEQSLYLGSQASPDVQVLAGPHASAENLGQGGEGGGGAPSEYGGFQPLAFSPDSQTFVYSSFEEAQFRGSMQLTKVDLKGTDALAKSMLLESSTSHELRLSTFVWPESGAIYLGADVEVEGRFDALRIDLETEEVSMRMRLPDGQMSYGFAWVPAGIVQLSDTDADYVPDRLSFTTHSASPNESEVLFEFGEEETPNWASFANTQSPRVGGFFSAVGLSAEYNSVDYRLWHFTTEGTLKLISGPLPEFGQISEVGEFDPAEKQFAFSLDDDGDEFYDVAVSRMNGANFGEASVIAELLQYSGPPQGFAWQP